jgi:hypothetical protein
VSNHAGSVGPSTKVGPSLPQVPNAGGTHPPSSGTEWFESGIALQSCYRDSNFATSRSDIVELPEWSTSSAQNLPSGESSFAFRSGDRAGPARPPL